MSLDLTSQEDGIYLQINGNISYGEHGKLEKITFIEHGKDRDEIWLKFSMFKATNDFSRSLQKQMENGNSDVIQRIMHEDQNIGRKKKRTKSSANTQKPKVPRWPATETNPEKTSMCLELEILANKSLGVRKFNIENIAIAPEEYRVREINSKWVQEIKQTLLEYPGIPVTILPGIIDPAQENTADKIEDNKVIALGGNHLLSAIKTVLLEERDNSTFDCLRYINIELYKDLNNDEARFDKVRVCRKTFTQHGDSEEINWKQWAAQILGHLNNREYTIEALSTVFSVSSYAQDEYELVEQLFRDFESSSKPGQSYPQNLFRALQGLKDNKLHYLSRAQGTNGIKESHKVILAKRREAVRREFARATDTHSWEEAQDMYPEAAEKVDQLAVCETKIVKEPKFFPSQLYDIAKRAVNFEEQPIGKIEIEFRVIISRWSTDIQQRHP